MTNFFYFDQSNQKQGPVTEEQLKDLATQGLITPTTSLETDTGLKGTAGQIPGLTFGIVAQNPFTQTSPFISTPSSLPSLPSDASPLALRLSTYFTRYWICLAVGIPLCIVIIGLPIFIAAIVFGCMLQYQLWKLIPKDIARTTPGKAIGYQFIPFFGFYWVFIAIKGLGEDMNKTLQRHGVQYKVNESLGLIACILCCCTLLDYVVTLGLVSIAYFVVLILFLKSVKNGGIALLEQGKVIAN